MTRSLAVCLLIAVGCGTPAPKPGLGASGAGGNAGAAGSQANAGTGAAGNGSAGNGTSGSGSAGTGACPPCVAPPSSECIGSGPCGCGPYTCPGDLDAGECPTFDAAFIASLKTCTHDDDCVVMQYQTNCCGTYAVPAVAKVNAERFTQCAPNPASFPACGCAAQATRAEDGRTSEHFDTSDVGARCTNGACSSYITTRSCGTPTPKTCGQNELCAVYQTSVGPSETLSYECVANPCTDVLACTCAQAVCALKTDVARSCSVDYVTDVYCADPRL